MLGTRLLLISAGIHLINGDDYLDFETAAASGVKGPTGIGWARNRCWCCWMPNRAILRSPAPTDRYPTEVRRCWASFAGEPVRCSSACSILAPLRPIRVDVVDLVADVRSPVPNRQTSVHKSIHSYLHFNFQFIDYEQGPHLYAFIAFIGFIGTDDDDINRLLILIIIKIIKIITIIAIIIIIINNSNN